ncbi:MAG: 2Fe-2S iron-sulfur cluster binding domain-containing protein [Chromatiales bacterium]|jgi:2Fe-2S ferredoxin|nr:2Fe-2S iron-sulfur cluster binding domain-containing protein [Chromatiales bacterium]
MPTIHVTNRSGKKYTLKADNGLTLMEPLREIDDSIEALCGGMCSCASCHIFISPEWFKKVPGPQSDETELLEGTETFRAAESRLACQVKVTDAVDGMVLTVAPEE